MTTVIVLALALSPVSPTRAQERGGGEGGRGEGGPGQVVPQPQVPPGELIRLAVGRIEQTGEQLFRDLEGELLGQAASKPRLGFVQLVRTPQRRSYVLGLIHEDLAVPAQIQPGQTPSEERSLGVLAWGPADGSGPLSVLLLRAIEKKDIRRGMVVAKPGRLVVMGQGRKVVWEGPSLVPDGEPYGGVDLRPNYIPRIVCMVTVDIESEDWPGFVPASEEGSVPTTVVCMDLGLAQVAGAPVPVAFWKVPRSVWRHEAVFKYRLGRSGRRPAAVTNFESVTRSLSAVLGAESGRGPESWALSAVRTPDSSECHVTAVRMSQSPQGPVDVDILRPSRHTPTARVEPFAMLLRFRRLQDGQWQPSSRHIDGVTATGGLPSLALVRSKPKPAGILVLAPSYRTVPFFGWFEGSIGLVLELPTGEALTFKNCGKSTSCACPHVPCRRPWE